MFQIFKCGHKTTVGMWKDDFWFSVNYVCPRCMPKGEVIRFKIGRKTLMVRKVSTKREIRNG